MKTRLIPAPGRRVLDPVKLVPLPPEGAEVELDGYWRRRLAQGDVVLPAPASTKSTKSTKPTPSTSSAAPKE
jgi:hypothetical protein